MSFHPPISLTWSGSLRPPNVYWTRPLTPTRRAHRRPRHAFGRQEGSGHHQPRPGEPVPHPGQTRTARLGGAARVGTRPSHSAGGAAPWPSRHCHNGEHRKPTDQSLFTGSPEMSPRVTSRSSRATSVPQALAEELEDPGCCCAVFRARQGNSSGQLISSPQAASGGTESPC